MITVEGLNKSFDGKKVIDNLNTVLKEGQITTMMGRSGCGKTTFAMILLGLLPPDSGTIKGLEDKHKSAVFQEDRLIGHLSAIENVKLVMGDKPDIDEIKRQFTCVGMGANLIDKPTAQLSGGQKRRVAIVRCMMAKSDFICLDEPFKGLDEKTKQKTMEYLKRKIRGKTVLFITHDANEHEFLDSDSMEILPN